MPIVALTGAGGAGRTTAARALELLGYESASFADRLRHLISMSTGLPEQDMITKADEPFGRIFTLQAFHIDGMCRLASALASIPDDAPRKMRERAVGRELKTPREVMDYVRGELFVECVSKNFWVDLFRAHYKPEKDSNLVIDDVVSEAEIAFVRQLGGVLVGIARPGYEANLDGCDLTVVNDGTIEQLQDRVLAQLFGRLRGVPLALADAPPPPAPALEPAAVQQTDDLRKQLDELTNRLRSEIETRDRQVAELTGERDRLQATLAARNEQLEALGNQVLKATPAPAAPATEGETDAAALAARLALALGLEAGLGRTAEGQPMLCIDLPAGRVSWPVAEETYEHLPRYDKAPAVQSDDDRRAMLLEPRVDISVSTDRALDREGSELAPVASILKDLILLAEGCKVHRAYRAKQPPKSDCPTCWAMWRATERLRAMGAIYREAD